MRLSADKVNSVVLPATTVTISVTPIMMPGAMPAINSLLMESPLETPKIMSGMEGGIMAAIIPPEPISPAARFTG